jgi:orotate phosphoribosyltransferase
MSKIKNIFCDPYPCLFPEPFDRISAMEDLRERLVRLVRERSFLRSKKPVFRLASGKMSKVYFDLRLTTLCPEGQYLIGNLLYQKLEEAGLSPRAAGGLTLGADPVACALAYTSFMRGRPIEAFLVRKEPKDHGRGRQIEGNVREGDPVVIVDDVLTTGGSTIKALTAAREAGLEVLAALVVLDRQEQRGRENVEELCPLYSLLRMEDFGDAL